MHLIAGLQNVESKTDITARIYKSKCTIRYFNTHLSITDGTRDRKQIRLEHYPTLSNMTQLTFKQHSILQ